MKTLRQTTLDQLSPKEREALAERADISPGTLRQYASGHRKTSSERAILIEKAAKKQGLMIPRSTMATACAGCEYAKQCEREKHLLNKVAEMMNEESK